MLPAKIVLADPPWKFGDSLPGKKRGASKHYPCMRTSEICALIIPPVANDALLFLWRVAAMQQEALDVMRAWGFTLKSEFVWVKSGRMGMGRYVRHEHEVCLIGTRGRGIDLIVDHGVRSVVFAPRGKHSEKPSFTYKLIERLVGDADPKVELFARRERPGWICFGDELGAPNELRQRMLPT